MTSRQVKAPISAHPLFPAVVAVWFAALFGLGSGVLPNILFEHAVAATGISSLIPSATPPLGATFRFILSPAFGLAGAALGFVLARRLAAAQHVDRPVSPVSRLTPRSDPVPQADSKRRPISVKEELGDTRLDPIADDDPTAAAPIPGRRRALTMAENEREGDFFTHAPLPDASGQPAPPEPAMEQPLELASFAAPEPEPEPVEHQAYASQVEPEPEQIFQPVAGPAPQPKQVFAAAAEVSKPVLPAEADLADLGMVALAERLGASLRNRRGRPASTPDFVSGLKADFGIETQAGEAPEVIAPGSAIFGGAGFDPVAAGVPIARTDEEEEFDDIGEAEENYSSLLAINHPVRTAPETASGDRPEARPFDTPANAPAERRKADPEETERALRSALATLQRMSGAA